MTLVSQEAVIPTSGHDERRRTRSATAIQGFIRISLKNFEYYPYKTAKMQEKDSL
jgi:hypothetical protein